MKNYAKTKFTLLLAIFLSAIPCNTMKALNSDDAVKASIGVVVVAVIGGIAYATKGIWWGKSTTKTFSAQEERIELQNANNVTKKNGDTNNQSIQENLVQETQRLEQENQELLKQFDLEEQKNQELLREAELKAEQLAYLTTKNLHQAEENSKIERRQARRKQLREEEQNRQKLERIERVLRRSFADDCY